MKLSKYIDNYLLYFGVAFFFIGITLSFYFEFLDVNGNRSSKLLSFNHFSLFIAIYAIFLAPAIEELCFRSIFNKKKYFKYFFYFGTTIIAIFSSHYYLLPLIILFILIFEFNNGKRTEILYFLSAIIFSLSHYNTSDFFLFKSYPSMISITGLGLCLTWIIVNFGLIYSIILHMFINTMVLLVMLIPYEMNVGFVKVVETESFIMEYQSNSYFLLDINSDIKTDMKSFLFAKNSSLENVNLVVCPNNKLNKLYFGNYNITIKRKKGSNKVLNCETFKELLEKSKISEQ